MAKRKRATLLSSISRFMGHAPSWEYLRNRAINPVLWVGAYPEAQRFKVMAVLATIADAFILRQDDIFRLLPNDRLIDIYKAGYPKGGADSCEFEYLAEDLIKMYGVPDTEVTTLPESTVADVIGMCLKASNEVG